jgi:hypothetical protein
MLPLAYLAGAPSRTGGTAFRRPPYFRTKKLAIVGATLSKVHTPWTDPTWTIAAHPCARPDCLREPDWYFDLHRPECFRRERKGWNPQYHTWLKRLQTPIFMQKEWPEIPMAVRYPLERIEAEFRSSVTGRLVATNHAAYLIALALTEGVTHIGLFGCQYSADTEHGVQRESLVYWMGRFEQAGGTLVVPQPNNLLRAPIGLYGYESHDAHGKLTPEYQAHPPMKVSDQTGPVRAVTITDDNAADRPPLQTPPDGIPIAWERSGLNTHA